MAYLIELNCGIEGIFLTENIIGKHIFHMALEWHNNSMFLQVLYSIL